MKLATISLLAIALAGAPARADNPRLAVGLTEHVGARVPGNLTFTDTDGHPIELHALFDGRRPVVLVLAYARCQMLCGVVLHAIADAVSHSTLVPGRDFLPVIVSIDPHETWQTARHRQDTLLSKIGRAGQRAVWPYLTGDDAAIHTLAAALGFRYAFDPQTQQFAHPAVVFVLTPDGRIAEYLRGVQYDHMDDAVTRAAAGTLTNSTAQDILSCFHFDPSLRRYGRQMQLFLRLGAATVLVALVSMILGLTWWNRRRRRP